MERGCKICDNRTGNTELHPREMMFGTAETFTYFQCAGCGCLQIAEVPADMARHYPPNYYSFPSGGRAREPAWRRRLKSARVRSALEGGGLLDRLLSPVVSFPNDVRRWMALSGATQSSASWMWGAVVARARQLAALGFSSLRGANPFIAEELRYPDGVVVQKTSLEGLSEQFDLIMMHHSFEHMAEPYAVLAEARRLLAPGGSLLLRIPLCSSEAFRVYGADWIQLDAPRHFYLHSDKSLRLLAERSGFQVASVAYDSTAYQFWGSEQNRRNIALNAPSSYAVDKGASSFTQADMDAFEAKARELNARADSDQACFMLRAAANQ